MYAYYELISRSTSSFVAEPTKTAASCGGNEKSSFECVLACPYNFITGTERFPGIDRQKMLNAFECSKVREKSIEEIGHKHACGHCLLACPYGKEG